MRKSSVIIFLSALMAVFFLTNSISISQVNEDHQQSAEKLEQLKKQIQETSDRAINFEKKSKNIGIEVTQIQKKLIKSAAQIQTIEDQILNKEENLRTLQETKRRLEENLKNKNFEMASTLGAMQRLSAQKTSVIAFRPDQAINTLRTTALLKVILPDLKGRANSLEVDLSQLTLVRHEIVQENTQLRQALTKLVISNNEIDELLKQRISTQKELQLSTKTELDKLKKFAETAKDLQQLIAKIENELTNRDDAARLAESNIRDKPVTDNSNIASYPELSGTLSFASAKGNLPLPARGSINQIFGELMSTGQRSKGITITTRSGATVISPHDGRIVFAGNFRTYGQLLIIAHGEGYHTLLAGMENINGIVGQWVLKGEPVGQMKTDADASGSRQKLYVEFRQKGKPINPIPWIMAADRHSGS